MERNRLYWASRRGMLELDLILMPFMEKHFDDLDESDQKRYEALLDNEDQDLFAWFLNRVDPGEEELRKIIRLIRERLGIS